MKNATIKAYYKAVTTTKRFIVSEDYSTNYSCYKYTATNNISGFENDYNTTIIDCEYYYENLDVLQYLFSDMMQEWTKNCYYYDWTEFLKRYELTDYQFNKIKRLIK
jgi:hypothetical protein